MDKKGFTLVELLGVIVILGLLVVVVATSGFGLFNKAKDSINKIEEDNLLETARVFLVDVDREIVDFSDIETDCPSATDTDARVCSPSDNKYLCNVAFLIENRYFKDDAKHCDKSKILELTIEKENGNTVGYKAEKQNADDIICTK